jgi:hypothetical protein
MYSRNTKHGIRNKGSDGRRLPRELKKRCGRSTNFRPNHRAQTRLGLFGEAGENHGDVIAGVLIAGAGDDDAVAIDATVAGGRLHREGHFRPRRKCRGAAEFNAVFVDDDRAGRKNQARLPGFDGDMLLEGPGFNFSRTHTAGVNYHKKENGQIGFARIYVFLRRNRLLLTGNF